MKKIVVLGAGFAGMKAVVELQKKVRGEAEITLVDRNPYHMETIRLYEVASGENPYTKMSYPVNDVINPKVTKFIQDEVLRVNYTEKKVELANHAPLNYDYCIIGLGFTLDNLGIDGVKENALPMYNVKTAQAIYNHISNNMKDYRETKDEKDLHIVICGAGFQAVELANAMAMARDRFAKMAGVSKNDIKITMLDGSNPKFFLPMFGDKQTNYALKKIHENGIEILSNAHITRVFSDSVYYTVDDEEKKVDSNNLIWFTGFSGSDVISASRFNERRNRVMVSEHLTAPESDDVYVLGDVSSVMVPGKNYPLPNTGQLAVSMGEYAAKDLAARVLGHARPNPYKYNDLGVVVDLGKSAVGLAMSLKVYGWFGMAMKRLIIDKSIMDTGGFKETFAIGRFDFLG